MEISPEEQRILDMVCADPEIDKPSQEDIDNYGANTDESMFINIYEKEER
jgi:hypothetical protein